MTIYNQESSPPLERFCPTMRVVLRKRYVKVIVLLCCISVVPYILLFRLGNDDIQSNLNRRRTTGSGHNRSLLPSRKIKLSDAFRLDTSLKLHADESRPHDEPMMLKYCNSPSQKVSGSEGNIPAGFQLKMVHVFIRHGDRDSIHEVPNYEPEPLNCKFGTWYSGSNRIFKRFASTMRKFAGKQSKTSHFLNWALFPDKDACQRSELSSLGALQHLHNGQHFQERYVTKSDLFDTKLAYSSQIYVRSTRFSRTYQSAIAFMHGLLPDQNITTLNIDSTSSTMFCTTTYSLKKDCVCKTASKFLQLSKKFDNPNLILDENSVHLKTNISKLFEVSLNSMPKFQAIMDAFAPALCHNMSTPCSDVDPANCINGKIVQSLWLEIHNRWLAQLLDKDQYYVKFANIMIHPVMQEMSRRMRDLIEKRPTHKFILYSGHDTTLSAILTVLGLNVVDWTPYASRLVIEMIQAEDEMDTDKFYLRFIFNGNDHTDTVVFCKGRVNNGLCPFHAFYDFINKDMIRKYGYTSFGDACSRPV